MGPIHPRYSCLLLAAAIAALAIAGPWDAPPSRAQSLGDNPPLTRVEVDIWPEYDRESAVLVIVRAEVVPEATLPAQVSVRIPASSGGPAAVAEAAAPDSQLLTVPHTPTDVQIDFMTIRFELSERFFHVEFYDPIPTDAPERSYRYLWPGDFSVGQLAVQVQEPATSSGFAVTPDVGTPQQRQDGLAYRETELGPQEAGNPVTIELQYSKTDARTSSDILGFEQAPAEPQLVDDDDSWWLSAGFLIPAVIVAAVIIGGAAGFVAWKQWLSPAPASRAERRRAGGRR